MNRPPQQPYLLRALYEWCVDSGYTPYINVRVDTRTRVPMAYVRDGQIVLNIGPDAVRNLKMDNEWVSFSARFGGVVQEILIPVVNIIAIYARETGEGMVFPIAAETASATTTEAEPDGQPDTSAAEQPKSTAQRSGRPRGKPKLRVVK